MEKLCLWPVLTLVWLLSVAAYQKPPARFQIQNTLTGKCLVILNNDDRSLQPVVINRCDCENKYQYWHVWRNTQGVLQSEGRQGNCMLNREKIQSHYPGLMAFGCEEGDLNKFDFEWAEDGTFQIMTRVDRRCVRIGEEYDNSKLGYETCDKAKTNSKQLWRYHDECNPEPTPNPKPTPPPTPKLPAQPTNVVPPNLDFLFKLGNFNWLNPMRYNSLKGGRWDAVNQVWHMADGKQIKPNTAEWSMYFGDSKPSFLDMIFQGGKSWDDVLGWMTSSFFDQWTGWNQGGIRPTPNRIQIVISGNIPMATRQLFASGQMNWLTPDRVRMLQGGQWTGSTYITKIQEQLTPGSPNWSKYFGTANAADVTSLFGGRGSWDTSFSWLTNALTQIPPGAFPNSFPWNSFSAQLMG